MPHRHPKITDMRGNAWARTVVICLGIAACTTPQATVDEVACTTLCRCVETLPSAREECVTGCIGDLGPVSDPCAECVSLHANECSTLFDDCTAVCFPAVPFQGGP